MPPYDTANLSSRGGDDPDAVLQNRRLVASACGLPAPDKWWWLAQEHGRTTVQAQGPAPHGPAPHGPPATGAPVADAAITAHLGVPLVILTADCAPIALATDDAIAVVHAGWVGLLAGVIDEAVTRLRGIGHGDVRAVLGPCIHPARYEFGRDDLDRVIAQFGPEVEGRTNDGKLALDLPTAVRRALLAAGVRAFDDVDVCTATSPDHYSHRRDGETGRQALVMVREQ